MIDESGDAICPECKRRRGRKLTLKEVEEGIRAGTYFNIDSPTGSRAISAERK
jgi:hypothetical protein